jgi:hypothetical protein
MQQSCHILRQMQIGSRCEVSGLHFVSSNFEIALSELKQPAQRGIHEDVARLR